MTLRAPANSLLTITAGARLFALIVLAPLIAFTRDYPTILSAILMAAVWTGATFAGGLPRIQPGPAVLVEAGLVSLLVGMSLESTGVLIPALVIPPFIAGTYQGARGLARVLGLECLVLLVVVSADPAVRLAPDLLALLFTWLMAGLGFGLIGAVVRSARLELGDSTRSSYRDARALLTQLLQLSDGLIGGLDPVSIANHIVDLAREEIPLSGAMLHGRHPDGTVTGIGGDGSAPELADRETLVDQVFSTGEPVVERHAVALPLMTDAGIVAVLTAGLAPGVDPGALRVDETARSLVQSLATESLKLDTALVFAAVRQSATTEERQRLAREMHDGVAQDLASFGYLIDDALASAESPAQATRLRELRTELSSVVTELRRSVFSLRNENGRGLGESITDLARHIEARTGIVVEVLRDESRSRLRPEVESELLRIAQEAMNNSVKHAHGSWIRVTCTVRAPQARVTVQDDGVGLRPSRDDSHGLRIMRERARRIGADIEVGDSNPGTLVMVTLGPLEGGALSAPHIPSSTSATSLEGSRT
ncbi:sensor histidine kinase [Nocardioides guangzhouensis]|uniref:Sensor histidine kinase n=1 Tax=Nocardioides guangzhouensis TaxID=2497878 RepID=A0A4Q4ZD62_9ACTN|nr:sensor histidine kinase [Nocardioides guangzhouensis]RYP85668.1 sensor histidine kinase [Nocardioides guangzhouensis]